MTSKSSEAGTCLQQARPQNENTSQQFSFPEPASVKGRVLGALLRGERLTHLDCQYRFGSSRLAHHAHVLRRAGWAVRIVERIVTTSDAGRTATIGEYFLDPETIAEAGEVGQGYARVCARIEFDRRVA